MYSEKFINNLVVILYKVRIFKLTLPVWDFFPAEFRFTISLGVRSRRSEVFFMFLEISQNLQETTCARVSFLSLLKERLWHRCFPVNFAKFLRTLFLPNTSGRLPLHIVRWLHKMNQMKYIILRNSSGGCLSGAPKLVFYSEVCKFIFSSVVFKVAFVSEEFEFDVSSGVVMFASCPGHITFTFSSRTLKEDFSSRDFGFTFLRETLRVCSLQWISIYPIL